MFCSLQLSGCLIFLLYAPFSVAAIVCLGALGDDFGSIRFYSAARSVLLFPGWPSCLLCFLMLLIVSCTRLNIANVLPARAGSSENDLCHSRCFRVAVSYSLLTVFNCDREHFLFRVLRSIRGGGWGMSMGDLLTHSTPGAESTSPEQLHRAAAPRAAAGPGPG